MSKQRIEFRKSLKFREELGVAWLEKATISNTLKPKSPNETQFKCLIIYNIYNVDIITENVAHASNNVCACACVQYSIFAYQISPTYIWSIV